MSNAMSVRRPLALLGVSVALAIAIVGSVIASQSPSVTPSHNWTGYVTHDHRGIVAASGSWTVPETGCDSTRPVGVWVGLGGSSITPTHDANLLEQAGVILQCHGPSIEAVAFTESFPASPKPVTSMKIHSGDQIAVLIVQQEHSTETVITDTTTGASVKSSAATPAARFTSAECIVEATPAQSGHHLDHVVVAFSLCNATRVGGSLSSIGDLGRRCSTVVVRHDGLQGAVTSLRCTGGFQVAIYQSAHAPRFPVVPLAQPSSMH